MWSAGLLLESTWRHCSGFEPAWILDKRFAKYFLKHVVMSKIWWRTGTLSDQNTTLGNFLLAALSMNKPTSTAFSAAANSKRGIELWWDARAGFRGTTWLFVQTIVVWIASPLATLLQATTP